MKNHKIIACLLLGTFCAASIVLATCDDKAKPMPGNNSDNCYNCAPDGAGHYPDSNTPCHYDVWGDYKKCDGTGGDESHPTGQTCSTQQQVQMPQHLYDGTCNGAGACSSGVDAGPDGYHIDDKGTLTNC